MNRLVTLAASGFIAAGLAILPVSAFAQAGIAGTPGSAGAPGSAGKTVVTAPSAKAKVAPAAKKPVKAPAHKVSGTHQTTHKAA